MSQAQTQLAADVAANAKLTSELSGAVANAFNAFSTALKTQSDNIAALKQQLVDAQAAGSPIDPGVLSTVEADNVTLQGIIDTANQTIAALNPPAAPTTDPNAGSGNGTNSSGA